jgi:hypothetical protein
VKEIPADLFQAVADAIRNGDTLGVAAKRVAGVSGDTLRRRLKAEANVHFALLIREAISQRDAARLQPHGSPARYRSGCKCDLCRSANAKVHKNLRVDRSLRRNEATFEHGRSAYLNWGCRCEVCTKDHTEACAPAVRRYQEANREELNQRTYVRRRPIQNRSLEEARRNGFQWTGPELELIARPDLTAEQAADMLGRTYFAVVRMRRRLHVEPKLVNLTGLSHEAQGDFDSRAS